ncbi:MAG TPA: AAA family ATPase [Vicinamibacterales bacterium]
MYTEFFGFRELPFELTPDPRFLFLTSRHREGLVNLRHALSTAKGMALLVGDAGTGKTTLLRAALRDESRGRIQCLYICNPALTRDEFVELIARGVGLSDEAARSKAAFLIELERTLRERRARGEVLALAVDEAQSLPYALLEEIRLLANIETETEKLLPVVLAGQPELADRLNEPSLRQLKQRIALRCELAPLTLEETASYIAGRIRAAGGDTTKVFTRDAVLLVHQRSRGIPRTINVICDNAFVTAMALDKKPVTRDVVAEVCRDFDFQSSDAPAVAQAPRPRPAVPAAVRTAAVPVPEPSPEPQVALPRRMFSFFS